MHRRTGERDVASGRSPNPGPQLVGREVELDRLASLLATARDGRGGVLLLEGEAGIGKTTLLDAAAARAEGFLVLRATGVEADAVLPYGGLLELLGPLRDRAAALPVGQAAALARVLGWDDAADGPVDRFLVAAATLSLLAEAAAAGPVLVLVDDLMWLDRESVSALLFAARRLGQDRVAVLLATRGGVVPTGLLGGIPVLAVPGLDEGDTRRMLGGSPRRWPGGCTAQRAATRWPCSRSPGRSRARSGRAVRSSRTRSRSVAGSGSPSTPPSRRSRPRPDAPSCSRRCTRSRPTRWWRRR